jgi:hypothetical protein
VENMSERENGPTAIWAILNVRDVPNWGERKGASNVDYSWGMVNDIVSFLSFV